MVLNTELGMEEMWVLPAESEIVDSFPLVLHSSRKVCRITELVLSELL